VFIATENGDIVQYPSSCGLGGNERRMGLTCDYCRGPLRRPFPPARYACVRRTAIYIHTNVRVLGMRALIADRFPPSPFKPVLRRGLQYYVLHTNTVHVRPRSSSKDRYSGWSTASPRSMQCIKGSVDDWKMMRVVGACCCSADAA
jgi:hypothetical protein